VKLAFEPLKKKHHRESFTSGDAALDDWFRKRALQDVKRDISRVFVAIDDTGVAGFYSLSAFTLALDRLPTELARKLPRYDAIPAALIGRLARAERLRGRGIGELLLADAIKRVLAVEESMAIFAIVVDSKNDSTTKFYRTFGFSEFPDTPNHLFLLTSTAREAILASIR
jgi:ribosomal protein S18 acetylase RimI-like enzyme